MFRLRTIRPLDGWRRFLGEVGTIVLGVLIAVSIGELVEAMNWRERTGNAREALGRDQVNHIASARERVAVTPCLLTQLDRLRSSVLAAGTRTRAPLVGESEISAVYRHPMRAWSIGAWESAVADAIPAHLRPAERETLTLHATSVRRLAVLNEAERDAGGALLVLHDPVRLDERSRVELLRVIAEQRLRAEVMALLTRQMIDRLGKAGLLANETATAGLLATSGTIRWCHQQRLPLAG